MDGGGIVVSMVKIGCVEHDGLLPFVCYCMLGYPLFVISHKQQC